MNNTLYYGDNLEIMRNHMQSESVDLIYLDPPFNSSRDYNILFKQAKKDTVQAQMTAFTDTWTWHKSIHDDFFLDHNNAKLFDLMDALFKILGKSDMMAYLLMMAPRLLEMHRILKSTGSLYLHCDPVASHYLKILLDVVFGAQNFRSEIIWRRTNSHNNLTRQYGPIHDSILFFAKSIKSKFHLGVRPYNKQYIESRFKHEDINGRFQLNYLTGPGIRNGESGKEWRSFNPTNVGRHWAIPKSLREFLDNDILNKGSIATLEYLYKKDLIVFPQKDGGQPMYKQYIGKGVLYQDIWAYQPNTQGILYQSKECIDEDVKYLESETEKLEYPTQKPVGLLERIIITSADKDSIIFDPFCGCGTAIIASEKLRNKWIGIDITFLAIDVMIDRLQKDFNLKRGKDYQIIGEPKDVYSAQKLFEESHKQFEMWAVGLANGLPQEKKGADAGIDGVAYFQDAKQAQQRAIIQVKGGNLTLSSVRDFAHVIKRENAAMGFFICLQTPTKKMLQEADELGFYSLHSGRQFAKLQVRTIKELIEGKEFDLPTGWIPTSGSPKKLKRINDQMGLGFETE